MTEVVGRYEGKQAHELGTVAYRDAIAGADSVNLSAPLSSGSLLRETKGRQTLALQVRGDSGSAQIRVVVALYSQIRGATVLLGYFEATVVLDSALLFDTGVYLAPLELFDLAGASHYEVRVTSLGAASAVSLRAWEY